MKKFHLTASLMLFASCLGLSAQTGPSLDYILPESNPYLVPPGPEAASFLQYGQIPVSYSTGIPDVSYPIYTIRSGSLTLPVTLNYLGGGIKVTDQASWAGLGWLLNAGGVIHRSINDLPDKYIPELPAAETIRQTNDYESLNLLMTSTIDEFRSVDKMRDRYDYSFAGKSGTFYITTGTTVLQVPYTDNIIEVVMNDDTTEPSVFRITDSEGVTYHFEARERVTTTSRTFTHPNSHASQASEPHEYTAAWYLTKIENFNKTEQIALEYTDPNISYEDFTLSHIYDAIGIWGNYVEPDAGLYPGYYCSNVHSVQTHSAPVLSKISFAHGSIEFESAYDRIDNRKHRLQRIILKDNSEHILKTMDLSHSYFLGNRLKLDRLEYKGSDGTLYDSYAFSYYMEDVMIPNGKDDMNMGLRNFGSEDPYFSRDLCGYYNGKPNATLLGYLPSTANGYSNNLADRSHSAEHAKAHSLRRIDYITGGYTELIYDDSLKYNIPRTPSIRIKEVRTVDNSWMTSSSIVKTYEYDTIVSSVPFDKDNLFCDHTMVFHYNEIKGENDEPADYYVPYIKEHFIYNSEPLVPGYENVCKVGYAKVEEFICGMNESYRIDVSDSIKNIYEYDLLSCKYVPTIYYLEDFGRYNDPAFMDWWNSVPNVLLNLSSHKITLPQFPDNPYPEAYNVPGYYIDKSWQSGNLIKESRYRYDNGEYVLYKTIENTYAQYCTNDSIPIGLYCKGTNFSIGPHYMASIDYVYEKCPSLNNFYFFDICVSTGWNKLVGTIVKEYDGDVVKQTSESFQYGNIENESCWHPYVTFSTKMFPDGNTTENSEYAYPATASGIMNEEVRQAMIAGNMISPVIRKKDIVMWDLQDGVRFYSDDYRLFDGKILWNSSSERYDGSAGSQWERKTEVMEHDCKGNPVWLTDESGYSTVIVWGYGNSLPVALIKNATPDAIRQVLDVDLDFKTLGNDLANMQHLMRLRAMMPEALVYTYSYEPLIGMTAMTDPAGTVWHYAYDSCGRLKETRTSWVAGPPSQTTRSYGYHYHNQ